MTWSYGSSLATDKDSVRFHIGDTDPDDPQLHDEEITALLTSEGGVMRAAIRAAEAIAARYARRTDFRVSGELHQSASQMYQHYLDLALRLRRRQSLGAIPYAGGISVEDKENEVENIDRVIPSFTTHGEEEPGTAPPQIAPFIPLNT
jgi:DNA polymerase III delta prime subunit